MRWLLRKRGMSFLCHFTFIFNLIHFKDQTVSVLVS